MERQKDKIPNFWCGPGTTQGSFWREAMGGFAEDHLWRSEHLEISNGHSVYSYVPFSYCDPRKRRIIEKYILQIKLFLITGRKKPYLYGIFHGGVPSSISILPALFWIKVLVNQNALPSLEIIHSPPKFFSSSTQVFVICNFEKWQYYEIRDILNIKVDFICFVGGVLFYGNIS